MSPERRLPWLCRWGLHRWLYCCPWRCYRTYCERCGAWSPRNTTRYVAHPAKPETADTGKPDVGGPIPW